MLEVEDISQISGHIEWASIKIKYIFPSKGPAKSMRNLCQGLLGHNQGPNGDTGGALLTDIHTSQDLANFSMSWSMEGH